MEFLKFRKGKKTLLKEVAYYGLNIGLAVLTLILVVVMDSFLPSLILIIISKWRSFAVRPRYWATNMRGNLLDLIFSISIVSMMFNARGFIVLQIILAVVYGVWLTIIKPMFKVPQMILQAALTLFLSITALFYISDYSALESFEINIWPIGGLVYYIKAILLFMGVIIPFLFFAWVIGYSVARHVLLAYGDAKMEQLSLICGLVVAELAWLFFHWTNAYDVPFTPIRIPQATIVILLFATVVLYFYQSSRKIKSKKIQIKENLPILIFAVITAIILMFFERGLFLN